MVVAGAVFAYLLWREAGVESEFARSRGTRGLISALRKRGRTVIVGSLVCTFLVVAIAGWWYLRNWLLYGDPLAFNVWVAIAGGRPNPITLLGLLDEFQGLRISFWGNFGGVNLIASDWVYTCLDALTVVAIVGLIVGLGRRSLPLLLALPALWFAVISISLVRWTLLTLASQGRLLFPAIAAVGILLAHGLSQFQEIGLASRASRLLLPVSIVFLFVFAALAPWVLIAPAYVVPPRLAANASVPNPVHINFEGQAELVGYDLPQRSAFPGADYPVTLYWRTGTRIDEDLSVYIRLYDAAGRVVGRWDAYPGNGLYPTRLWQPGELIVDSYRVPVAADAQRGGVGRIEAGLFRRMPLQNLTARDPRGNVITPTFARFKMGGGPQASLENPVDIRFGERIALSGYSLAKAAGPGSTLTVRLNWRALERIAEDYSIFVHLVAPSGVIPAQHDGEPQNGTFPTSFWDPGETILDEHTIAIPEDAAAGEYRVEVGVYRPRDNARLPVQGSDFFLLGKVAITR
jgi:hypothetical protein